MTVQEVANRLVELCRQGQNSQAYDEIFSDDAIALEPEGFPNREVKGLDALRAKSKQFGEMLEEMHSMEISDPIVADNFFSCTMKMDVTYKGQGRQKMEEVCVYEVKDGKIVKEQFFFTPQMPA